jgi:Immunity protein 7
MYQYTGWFKIAESTREINEGGLRRIIESLQQLIDSLSWGSSGFCRVHATNGFYFLLAVENRNHRGIGPESIDIVLDFLCKEAPGSHGLLYWLDHEDPNTPREEAYRIKVLARGRVTVHYDPFFSPFIPNVEDYVPGEEA